MSIQIERVRQGEANQVPHGLSALAARFPVDDPRELPSRDKKVSEPEVAMDGGAWCLARAESRVNGTKRDECRRERRVVTEAASQERDAAVVHVHRLGP